MILPVLLLFAVSWVQAGVGATSSGDDVCSHARCGTVRGEVRLADGGVPAGSAVFLQAVQAPRPSPVGEYVLRDDDFAAVERGRFRGVVNATGHVVIRGVLPGRYIVVIQVPGYVSPESEGSPVAGADRAHTVVVSPGTDATFQLLLRHGGTIQGTVRYDDGRPTYRDGPITQQVALSLVKRQTDGSFTHAFGAGAAHADKDGRFTFSDLPPGDYVVLTSLPAPMVATSNGLTSANGAVIFSGGTARLSRAAVTHVHGTETEQTTLVLPTRGLRSLSGKVLAPDGSAWKSGLIRIEPAGDSASAWMVPISSLVTPLAADGTFQFPSLLPDRYELWMETQPEVKVVGITDDRHGVRMRATPSPVGSPHMIVDLNEPVTAPVTLQLTAAGFGTH